MKLSLIVFGALALSLLLRRRSAALRHWVLAAGIACAAALPILTAAVPAWPLPFAAPTAFAPYEDAFRDSASASPMRPPRTASRPSVAAPRPPAAASLGGFDSGAIARSI